jgi:hypothetical protein
MWSSEQVSVICSPGWPICVQELIQYSYSCNNTLACADDDTWVNMPLMQSLLAHYNETHPFALGLVRRTALPPAVPAGHALTWLGGGAGIFMSQVSP